MFLAPVVDLVHVFKLEGEVKMTFVHTCPIMLNCARPALVTKIHYMSTAVPLVVSDSACF
jgi:hypothetical protein